MGEVGIGIYPDDMLRDVFDVLMQSVILDERLEHPRDATLFLDTLGEHGFVMAKSDPVPQASDAHQNALDAIVAAIYRAATFTGWFGDMDALWSIDSIEGHGYRLAKSAQRSRQELAKARAALAAAVRAPTSDRHFRGLPESPEVIAAYDAVRAAEAEVAKLERDRARA